jgi:hypothetical protein
MTNSERTDATFWALLAEPDPLRDDITELSDVDPSLDRGINLSLDRGIHLSPDSGIQAYSEPYPRTFGPNGSTRGSYIPGRAVLQVSAIQGDWVHVTADGDAGGWVVGQQLVPPVSVTTARLEPDAVTPAVRSASATVSANVLVGVLAGVGVVIGALIDWTHGIAVNSFEIPARFVFDPNTTSLDPRLRVLVVAIGLLGVLVSFFSRARVPRVLLGFLALLAAVQYGWQLASQLSGTTASFADTVGAGPWVTGIAGIVLAASAQLAE